MPRRRVSKSQNRPKSGQQSSGLTLVLNRKGVPNPYVEMIHAFHSQQRQESLIEQITQHIRQSLDLQEILQTTVVDVRQFLQVDRVMIQKFNPLQNNSLVVAEALVPNYPSLLGWILHSQALSGESYTNPAVSTRVQAIADITQANLATADVQLLQAFGVKSQLFVPIVQGQTIWGFLVAHQGQTIRQWQPWEIRLLKRLENHLAVAIQQAELFQKVRTLNAELEEKVQERTLQLSQSLKFSATVQRIIQKISESLDEDQILQTVVEEVGSVLRLEGCDTRIYNTDHTLLTLNHEYTTSLPPALGAVLQPERIPDHYCQWERVPCSQFCPIGPDPVRPITKLCTIMVCPMTDHEQVLGALWLFRDRLDWFDDLETQLVQQIANQCAIALRQSRLYRAAQTQVDELAQLNRLKDDFLSTVSHELRTPLSSIKMSIQLLELILQRMGILSIDLDSAEPQYEKIKQCLRIMRDESDREINLITDLLTLQQLEAGTQPFIPTTLALQSWIPQIVDTFDEQAKIHQQTIHLEIGSDLAPITTDLFMFNRILGELLTNACKFTPDGQSIIITVTPHPPFIQIRVTNIGNEIPASELENVFNQFYRIPDHDPWKHGGMGIGLALVKKMVAYLHGEIEVESGNGATHFVVRLPLCSNRNDWLSHKPSN